MKSTRIVMLPDGTIYISIDERPDRRRLSADAIQRRKYEARWKEVEEEAETREACLDCLSNSAWWSAPKFIKHRKRCPYEATTAQPAWYDRLGGPDLPAE